MATEAVEVVTELFRRMADGDDPFPLLDENITWAAATAEGPFIGHRGVAEFFLTWIGTWDEYRIVLENVMAAPDGRVIAMFCEEGSGRGSGVPVHLHPASVWEVKDGKVISYKAYLDHDEALKEAGLQA